MDLRRSAENIRCGMHSGIPWCCILWFTVGPWSLAWEFGHQAGNAFANWYRPFIPYHGNYVACPVCVLRKRVVELKRCECFGRKTADTV